MAEMPERDAAFLLDMLLAARDALSFVEGLDEAAFLKSRLHQSAAIRALEVIGEAAGRVSAATQAAHPEIPWREIRDRRQQAGDRIERAVGVVAGERLLMRPAVPVPANFADEAALGGTERLAEHIVPRVPHEL